MRTFLGLVLWMIFPACFVHAGGLEEADYTTPDRWARHVSAWGISESWDGNGILDGSLDLGLTTRFRMRSNDYASDSDFYQYLRAHLTDVSLGGGTVSGNLFARVTKDTDGRDGDDWGSRHFYLYGDSLDAEEGGSDWSGRLYHGYLRFSDVVENSEVVVGRIHIDHLQAYQVDGADVSIDVMDDRVEVFAYAGVPVSHFVDTDGDILYGGGLSAMLLDHLRLRAELSDVDVADESSLVLKLRADYSHDYGTLYGEYADIEGIGFYKLGCVTRYTPTMTTVVMSYEELVDEYGSDEGSFVVNPVTSTLLPYGEYSTVNLKVYQGINSHLNVGVGAKLKDARGTEDLDNRDYVRYFANLDVVGLPHENTYFTFTVDYWDIDSTEQVADNKQLLYSGQISHALSERIDLWLGTSFERYRYDAEDDVIQDWVRIYYLGAAARVGEEATLSFDLSYEDSDILASDDGEFEQNFDVELSLNVVF